MEAHLMGPIHGFPKGGPPDSDLLEVKADNGFLSVVNIKLIYYWNVAYH